MSRVERQDDEFRQLEAIERRLDTAERGLQGMTQWLSLQQATALTVPNSALFVDVADGLPKFKDSTGTLHALY